MHHVHLPPAYHACRHKKNAPACAKQSRTSCVGGVSLISIASAACCQFGERYSTNSKTRAIAVQEQLPPAYKNDYFYEAFDIFTYESPPRHLFPATLPLSMETTNRQETIHMGKLTILAASTAASIHIGNSCSYTADARVKHIRKFGL